DGNSCIVIAGASFPKLQNNTIYNCGQGNDSAAAVSFNPNSSGTPTTNFLADGNTIHDIQDFFVGGPTVSQRTVIRNNTLGPSTGTSLAHIDGLQLGQGDTFLMLEGNLEINDGGTDNHFFLAQWNTHMEGATGGDQNAIIRYNVGWKSGFSAD